MDHLFSPWRYQYIREARSGGEGGSEKCVLCHELAGGSDERNLVVLRAQHNAILLNRFPYTSGHMMILPYAHCATLAECGAAARTEMMELAARAEQALRAEYQAQGLNVGLNLGEAAGAGIAGHLHLHVVPRWGGDANFMSVIGETRVLPEALSDTYTRLRRAFSSRPSV
ncbi:MAG: HIT family protein [Terriglobales bacterium]